MADALSVLLRLMVLILSGKQEQPKEEVHEFIGREIVADLYGVNAKKLSDVNFLKRVLEDAAKESNMTVVNTFVQEFQPQGHDLFVSLAESNITAHVYPEHDACFINVFTCGRKSNPLKGIMHIIEKLEPREVKNMQIIPRGLF